MNSNRLKSIVTQNSITSESNKPQDNLTPYTLIEWINNTSIDYSNIDEAIPLYDEYLRKWNNSIEQYDNINTVDTKTIYINLLKEITLTHTTEEEKRHFQNIDFNNAVELDIILPFYARKIKEIILYIVKQRELMKYQKSRFSIRASNTGVERLILDHLTVNIGDLDTPTGNIQSTNVVIEELFDLSDNYYNT